MVTQGITSSISMSPSRPCCLRQAGLTDSFAVIGQDKQPDYSRVNSFKGIETLHNPPAGGVSWSPGYVDALPAAQPKGLQAVLAKLTEHALQLADRPIGAAHILLATAT